MLGRTPTGVQSPAGPSDGARRGLAISFPLVALVGCLTLTGWLAMERDADLAQTQWQYDEAARQEFTLELESARHHVEREIDRLSELMMGITAFTEASRQAPADAVDAYLELTGARDRFEGLVDALVLVPSSAVELFFDPNQVELSDELRPLLSAADATSPALSRHVIDGQDLTVVSFTLRSEPPAGWGALVFDSETFLGRAVAPTARIRTTLVNTGRRVDAGPATPIDPDAVAVEVLDNGRLAADASIGVFGTEFLVRSVSTPGFLAITSRTQVWILLGAGAVAAFALYAALRALVRARASALESARRADSRRAAVDRRFRASFELAPIGMAELDASGRLVEVNSALCRQTGHHREAILGRPLSSLVHEADREAHVARVQSLLDGTADAAQGEHRYQHPDGTDIWVHESISVISADPEGGRSLLIQSQDITAQRRAAWELAQQALHDDLTGLPNRALFLNRLRHALVRANRQKTRVAVMFIDLDRFKVINDSLGHDVGDDFLIQIAARIGTAVRSSDTVARFGGDEFVVLCESVSGESEASATAERIQAVLAKPLVVGTTETYTSASIGITLSQPGDESADALLRDADAAMYRAKDAGRNRTEIFDHSMRSNMVARMEIESQLRGALDSGEIVMHYQAIVDPDTHLPAGYEALIRWNHPEKGLLGPAAFLPVAEEAGLIHLIDSFALRSTCRQIAKWVREYPAARNLYVATNWSARHLGRFVEQVDQVLAETRINPHQLMIEVTEGFLLEDSDASLRALQQLKQMGVQIAIDDFGTGYSSLSYLTRFAVDYLKIDQSFVSKLPEDGASAAVIGAIADMAARLGIKLVAEGVETEEQIEMLAALGAPRLQGYRFAKPRPAADIERHLAVRSGLRAPDGDDEFAMAIPLSAAANLPDPGQARLQAALPRKNP